MTILAPYTPAQYVDGLRNLLPQGLMWESFKNPYTYMYKTLAAFASSFSDLDQGLCEVIDEVFPATSTNLLPIWQETLGLEAGTDTLEQQRQKVVAKLTMEASLSRQYYINYAKQLGYEIIIKEYGAVIPGIYRIGDSVGTTDDYTYEFQITIIGKNAQELQQYLQNILPAYIQTFYVNT